MAPAPDSKYRAVRSRSPPLKSITPSRVRERGAALILTMLVVTMLLIVVLELRYSTTIKNRVSLNLQDDIVMHEVAAGALQRARVQLILDLESSLQQDQGSGAAGGLGGLGGLGGGGSKGGTSGG